MLPREPFDLQRFVDAQDAVFPAIRAELRAGRKESHWMWFIFPQLRGLGQSSTARFFGISSLEEAAAYLQHPVLGPRLRECTELINAIENRPASQIFGYPDDMKFRSSMTLFAATVEGGGIFDQALRKYFAGEPDSLTVDLLRSQIDSNGQFRKTPRSAAP